MPNANLVKAGSFSLPAWLFIVLLFFASCDELGDLVPDNPPPPGIPAVDQIVEEEILNQELIGLAVGVVQNGNIMHLEGYGYRDREQDLPMTTQTLIRWASISKPLTAVAAMKLVNAGHLDLDKDVRDYVSDWPAKSQGTITMRHLLTNTSGIGHYDDSGFSYDISKYDGTQPYNASKSLDVFKDQALLFSPGSAYNYSTFGFNLAAAVIDAVAQDEYNQSFPDFVRDSIAEPLGMTTLQPDYSDFKNLSPRTQGYYKNCGGTIRKEGTDDVSWKLGGGGWISNVEDLTRFMQALMNDELLPAATLDTLLTEQSAGGNSTGYGLGFEISGTRVGHSGWQQNGRNYMYFFTNQDLGIVIMANSKHISLWRIFTRIANALGRSYTINDYNLFNILDCDDEDECKDASVQRFSGVWRAGETDQLIRRGYTTGAFNTEWTKLSGEGYRLLDLDTYLDVDGSTRLWDGVFTKGSGAYSLWRNFSTADFNTKWQEESGKGLRLIDLETYLGSSGDRLWAGVFVAGSGKHALFRNMSFQEFHDKWDELNGQGYRLIDIETYLGSNGDRLWAGVWTEGTDKYALYRGYTTSDFNAKWQELAGQGYRLIDVETYYSSDGTQRWAGVWREGTDSYRLNRNWRFCGWLEKHLDYNSKGLELLDLEAY